MHDADRGGSGNTRPTTGPSGIAFAAIPLGILIGLVQAAAWAGFLHSRRQHGAGDADRGFGSGPNLAAELGWLLAILLVSVALLAIALPLLKIRWWPLLLLPVLTVQFLLAGWLGSTLPGHSDWRALVLAPILAVELLIGALTLQAGRRDRD